MNTRKVKAAVESGWDHEVPRSRREASFLGETVEDDYRRLATRIKPTLRLLHLKRRYLSPEEAGRAPGASSTNAR